MAGMTVARLDALASAALARRGVPEEHARYVVDGLLFASRRGVDTHGVRLLPIYLAELDGGRSRARPHLAWLPGRGAARVLDAGHALGLVAVRIAAAEAVALARTHGVGAVAVANSNHFGAASYCAAEMARHGMVGMVFSNSDALVAPFHGRVPLFGTNPLSVAAEGEDGELFCADLATSQASYSQVKARRQRGEVLPAGWAIGEHGQDAAELPGGAAPAALLPLGGHKGQCLGMAVTLLCSLLAGMPLDHELSHLFSPPFDAARQVAHLLIALDVGAFTDPAAFRPRLSRWLALVRQQPAVEGESVIVPGDLEAACVRARRDEVPLVDDDLRALAAIEEENRRPPAGAKRRRGAPRRSTR
jgi:LDH2 family malate/lactate/ureidoglycolate dehydrogenase